MCYCLNQLGIWELAWKRKGTEIVRYSSPFIFPEVDAYSGSAKTENIFIEMFTQLCQRCSSEVDAVPFFLPPLFYSILQSHWTTNKVTMKVMIKEKESNKAKLTITQSVPCIPVRNPLRADNKYDNYTAISNTVLDCGWLLEHQVVQLRVKQLRGYECVTGCGAPPS